MDFWINSKCLLSWSDSEIKILFCFSKVSKNDGLPSLVCHKCLVIMDNFTEYRSQITANDEKLRKMFDISNGDCEIDDDLEVVKLDPNKVYESSDEEESQARLDKSEVLPIEIPKQPEQNQPFQQRDEPKARATETEATKKEIFHCKYCDIVFPDKPSCSTHENSTHDPQNPFECLVCKLNFTTHPSLIIHIKTEHKTEKPYLCQQCTKTFVRRSDLRKHVFVHAGIRLFNCNLCSKSFTRSTNLAKHKRTHEEAPKTYRCMLCPKAFNNNVLLSHHMEMHMNRNTFNCKFCNLVFTHRDELEVHQKSHIPPPMPQPKIQTQQQQQAPVMGFYSQIQLASPPRPPVVDERPTLNFYNQESQLKSDYPIMNQLLSTFKPYKCGRCIEAFPTFQQLQNHQQIFHTKNFTCTLCNLSYFKKKELDRHIASQHTDIRYNCSKCSKSFARKDKLARHEKIHLLPQFFNCHLCTAVFIRKHLLDLHMKIHEMPKVNQIEPLMIPEAVTKVMPQLIKLPSPVPPEDFPMNLSMNNKALEPIDLSNERHNKIIIDSDDDDLKIIENIPERLSAKPNGNFMMQNPLKTDTIMTDLISGFLPAPSSRSMEAMRDLPMEILQSPDL